MRSSRSTHAILSLPHKYRVPQGRKRSLGYARDDDTRERAISHSLSFLHVEGCPCGAVYPPPSARPFFKGLHNSHVKTLTLRKVSSPISSFQAKQEIFVIRKGLTLSPHMPCTSLLFSSVFHTASALSAPSGHLPLEGKADDTGIPSSKIRRSRHLNPLNPLNPLNLEP